MIWTTKAQKYLTKYWKIDNLKDKQYEVINELLLGNDVIGLLPTGYGKSMCYLIPPLVSRKVMIIISPLISLMDDQKDKLIKMKIPCSALHGNNKNKDQELFQIMDGKIKIVYMSPEYLIKSDGIELARTLIETNKLGFLAVDESHCVSVWGQDFRPEYTKIKLFREEFPEIPILAVTATATDTVCQDITNGLSLNNPILVRASFDRPNLYIKILEIPTKPIVEKRKIKNKQIPKEELALEFISKYPSDKIIIYANSRADTEEIATNINLKNKCCEAYHAGLSKNLREEIQNKFIEGSINVIVSTIAFGMGIDQKVKGILIFGCPSSIEEYYQQIGRGGRDGKDCETILYFDYGNLIIGKYMIKDLKMKYPSLYKAKINNLDKMGNLAFLNTCRRKFILEYFNETCDFFTCGNCDNCCENELIDLTDKIWPILMKQNSSLLGIINEIRNNYLVDINYKDKSIQLDLLNPLWKWKNYIMDNKIKKDDLPEKLKIKIPKKFVKINETKKQDLTFDDKIEIFEKLIK